MNIVYTFASIDDHETAMGLLIGVNVFWDEAYAKMTWRKVCCKNDDEHFDDDCEICC